MLQVVNISVSGLMPQATRRPGWRPRFQAVTGPRLAGRRGTMREQSYLEQRLVDEVQQLREEANCLPPGDLRRAVEEIAEYAERLLALLRSHDGDVRTEPDISRRRRREP
jgi:hypothetical protein